MSDDFNTATDNLRTNPYEMKPSMEENLAFVKAIWKSAHAVEDFPGKVTIRRFSPYKKVCVVGEGATKQAAWRNAVERVEKVCAKEQGRA
jgi:hypothetical protein